MDPPQIEDVLEVPTHHHISAVDRGCGNVLSIHQHRGCYDLRSDVEVRQPSCFFPELDGLHMLSRQRLDELPDAHGSSTKLEPCQIRQDQQRGPA